MVAILSLLAVLAFTLMVARIATTALTLTGLSRETARFQARSALTGAGYTTTEAEQIVDHPVRRRIVMMLMLVGSAGIVTVIASLVVGFAGQTAVPDWGRVLTLLGGLGLLVWASASKWFNRLIDPVIRRVLQGWTDIELRDYAALLRIHGDYAVSEVAVGEDSWLTDRTLKNLRLSDEGVLVLGVRRDGEAYLGAPRADVVVRAGDVLVIYGAGDRLQDLDTRPRGRPGEDAHREATADQQMREVEEQVAAGESTGDGPPPPPTDPPKDRPTGAEDQRSSADGQVREDVT